MAGYTTKDMFDRILTKVDDLDVKFDAVKTDVTELKATVKIYRDDRKAFMAVVTGVAIAAIVTMVTTLPGCTQPNKVVAVLPTIETPQIYTATPTHTATPIIVPSITPIPAATLTPTATPAIIEVDPRPAWELVNGTFTPHFPLYVRSGPGRNFPVVYRLGVGKSVAVLAQQQNLPEEVWLCLSFGEDVFGIEFVAYIYDRQRLGELLLEP
jgi:outer membrane murein-binding lipoprotein Lpp